MERKYVLGVDIGGTNIRMGIVDSDYRLEEFERRSCQELLSENAIPNLIDAIKNYLANNEYRTKVKAVSVGIPGQVGSDHSYVYSVPKVQGLQHTALGQQLSEALGLPVYVGHDVNFLIYNDIRTMNLDPDHNKTIIGCYVGTGFGNALYINGQIHMGKHGVSGELGHVPLYGVEDVCNCGAVGCVETRCCGQYLAQLVEREFPDCYISDIFTEHGDDPRIIQFIKDCALPIATEITILDPDYVILGGGVITMKNFPTRMLEEEIRKRSRHPLPAENIQFIYTSDSQANGVVGGGMMVLDWLEDKR